MEKIGMSKWARDNYFLLAAKMEEVKSKFVFSSEIVQRRLVIEKMLKEIEQMQ